MSEYFENDEYFEEAKTAPLPEVTGKIHEMLKVRKVHEYMNIDYNFYTRRRSERKVIGYVKKQD